MRKVAIYLIALMAIGIVAGVGAAAPAFPDRPVEIIAPAGAGGGFDLISRMTARALGEERLVTQPLTVTNMPGGSGVVALAHVITRRKGDPYTLIAFSPATSLQMVNKATPYTYKDVVPLASLIADYGVLVTRRDSAIRDFRTLIQVLRQNPGAATVAGGSAPGSLDHIILAKAMKAGGVDPLKVRYVPFQGGGEAMAALLGGNASVITTGASEVVAQLEGNQVRVLALFAEQRLGGVFRTSPTAMEQGFNVTFPIWRGFYGAPDMPATAQRFWQDTLVRMTRTKAWAKVLDETKWNPFILTGDAFVRFLDQDTKNLEALLKELGFVK